MKASKGKINYLLKAQRHNCILQNVLHLCFLSCIEHFSPGNPRSYRCLTPTLPTNTRTAVLAQTTDAAGSPSCLWPWSKSSEHPQCFSNHAVIHCLGLSKAEPAEFTDGSGDHFCSSSSCKSSPELHVPSQLDLP